MANAAREMRMCEGKIEHRRHIKAQSQHYSLGNQQGGSVRLVVATEDICLLIFLFLKFFQNSAGAKWISEDIQSVAPTRNRCKEGPDCLLLFLLLKLSYVSQNVA